MDAPHAPNIRSRSALRVRFRLADGSRPFSGGLSNPAPKVSDALTSARFSPRTKVFSPSLTLGAGAGIVRQLGDTKVFPFVIVPWPIDDRWQLGIRFRRVPRAAPASN